jgi:putative transcriptional regulator
MKKSDFDGLMRGLKQARAFAKGKPVKGTRVHVPDRIDVAAIRKRAGVSQADFSRQIGVSLATLRNWEQRRRAPQGPARVLLALLASEPRIVEKVLSKAA